MSTKLERIEVAGCPLDIGGVEEFINFAAERRAQGTGCTELSMNALKVVEATRSPEILEALRSADVVGCDGVPLRWAVKLALGRSIPRLNGTDLMDRLLDEGSANGWRFGLLGSTDDTLDAMASTMRDRHPGAEVVARVNGFDDMADPAAALGRLADARPDVVFVALPSPTKELLMDELGSSVPGAIAVAVGGSFDVYVGVVSRAPVWMQRAGLEWFHRFAKDPIRLWQRYTVVNAHFLRAVVPWVVERRRLR